MSGLIHYELEVLYGTIFQPLCENQAGRDAIADIEREVEMTDRDEEVTCPKCLAALGYVAGEQLTETHGDPMLNRRAA